VRAKDETTIPRVRAVGNPYRARQRASSVDAPPTLRALGNDSPQEVPWGLPRRQEMVAEEMRSIPS